MVIAAKMACSSFVTTVMICGAQQPANSYSPTVEVAQRKDKPYTNNYGPEEDYSTTVSHRCPAAHSITHTAQDGNDTDHVVPSSGALAWKPTHTEPSQGF